MTNDQIVSTALPTIAEELNATPSEYSWVGTVSFVMTSSQLPVLPARSNDHDAAEWSSL